MHVRRGCVALEHPAKGVDASTRMDVAEHVPGIFDRVRRAQQGDQTPVLDGATGEDDMTAGARQRDREGVPERKPRRPVDHETQGAGLVVLQEQHHGAREPRVREPGSGQQEHPAPRLEPGPGGRPGSHRVRGVGSRDGPPRPGRLAPAGPPAASAPRTARDEQRADSG